MPHKLKGMEWQTKTTAAVGGTDCLLNYVGGAWRKLLCLAILKLLAIFCPAPANLRMAWLSLQLFHYV